MAKQLYTASEAASALGISLDTLRRWDKAGRIEVQRDTGNRRVVAAPRSTACAATAARASARATASAESSPR